LAKFAAMRRASSPEAARPSRFHERGIYVSTTDCLIQIIAPARIMAGYPWQPLEKKGGERKMSRDFVYGAMTLLLAGGLVAALTFLQGVFSVV
jgi:hypothetical protein